MELPCRQCFLQTFLRNLRVEAFLVELDEFHQLQKSLADYFNKKHLQRNVYEIRKNTGSNVSSSWELIL